MGTPDLVVPRAKLAVFCDGDFWHGRDWLSRKQRLLKGQNSDYWVAKIQRNRDRDRAVNRKLAEQGWKVVRLWETDVLRDPEGAAEKVLQHVFWVC